MTEHLFHCVSQTRSKSIELTHNQSINQEINMKRVILILILNLHQALSPAESLAETGSTISDDNFVHGFFAALSVIIVSELGDKTFFIAAILSMKHPRLTVYLGIWLHPKKF